MPSSRSPSTGTKGKADKGKSKVKRRRQGKQKGGADDEGSAARQGEAVGTAAPALSVVAPAASVPESVPKSVPESVPKSAVTNIKAAPKAKKKPAKKKRGQNRSTALLMGSLSVAQQETLNDKADVEKVARKQKEDAAAAAAAAEEEAKSAADADANTEEQAKPKAAKGAAKRAASEKANANDAICSVASESPDTAVTCYSLGELRQIARNVNRRHGSSSLIPGADRLSLAKLHARLKEVLMAECDTERCWAERYNPSSSTSFVPLMPGSWVDARSGRIKPEWLSNEDIEDSVRNDTLHLPHFRFLGVLPIDFASFSPSGECVFKESCRLDVSPLARSGITQIAMVFNLDRHDQPGSHWTALFSVLDASDPRFGFYYFDSTAAKPPQEIEALYDRFLSQLEAVYGATTRSDPQGAGTKSPGAKGGAQQQSQKQQSLAVGVPAEIKSAASRGKLHARYVFQFNDFAHQTGSTECGIHSLWFINRMLKPNARFIDVCKQNVDDDLVKRLRTTFFQAPPVRSKPAA